MHCTCLLSGVKQTLGALNGPRLNCYGLARGDLFGVTYQQANNKFRINNSDAQVLEAD